MTDTQLAHLRQLAEATLNPYDPEAWRAYAVGVVADRLTEEAAAYLEALDPHTILDLLDRIEQLEAWRTEGLAVLDQWEKVWKAAGEPGPLGLSKAQNVLDWVLDVKEDRGFQHHG